MQVNNSNINQGINHNVKIAIIVGGGIIALTIAYVIIKGIHLGKDNSSGSSSKALSSGKINPKNYDIKVEKQEVYKSANQCNPSILFPLKSLNVDYGLPPIPDNSPGLIYMQPP